MTPPRLPPLGFIRMPVHRAAGTALPPGGRWTDLAGLCEQAGVRLRVTAPRTPTYVYQGEQSLRLPDALVVAVPEADLSSWRAALRALEVLAHGFHDHAARTCVCGRGYFGVDAPLHDVPAPRD